MIPRKSNAVNSNNYYRNQTNEFFTVRSNHIPIVDILRSKENVWVMDPTIGINNAYNTNIGGNIGINTTTPQVALDVNGDTNISGNAQIGGNITINQNLNLSSGSQILFNSQSVLTPVGSIIAFMGMINVNNNNAGVPSGWFYCDGKDYPISSYTNLFNIIGYNYGNAGNYDPLTNTYDRFCVPDLRGTFLRGAYTNENTNYQSINGQYTGPELNSFQEPAIGTHTHTFEDAYISVSQGAVNPYRYVAGTVFTNGGALITTPSITNTNNNVSGNLNQPYDNRPFNIGVNWIIKY